MKSIEIDRAKRLKEEPHTGHNRWHPDTSPIIEVAPGEEVVLETRENALLVSKKAILHENQEPIVYLVQDGIARRYVLEPGFSSQESTEVRALIGSDGTPLESIPEENSLVVLGNSKLKDGSRVEIEGEPGSP